MVQLLREEEEDEGLAGGELPPDIASLKLLLELCKKHKAEPDVALGGEGKEEDQACAILTSLFSTIFRSAVIFVSF